jgi:hypothetical protein
MRWYVLDGEPPGEPPGAGDVRGGEAFPWHFCR